MFMWLVIAAALAGAGNAGPAPLKDGQVFTAPDWARKPTSSEMSSYYPETAALFSKPGRAVIQCTVSVSGDLENCFVVEETPPELGFGQAALEMAAHLHMKPALVDGQPAGGHWIRMPISFAQPPSKFPGLTDSLACYGRFTAHISLDPAQIQFVDPARRARKQANWLMRLKRMSRETRDKRLEVEVRAASKAVVAGQALDARTEKCLKLFAP